MYGRRHALISDLIDLCRATVEPESTQICILPTGKHISTAAIRIVLDKTLLKYYSMSDAVNQALRQLIEKQNC
jgi:hypothetical protein